MCRKASLSLVRKMVHYMEAPLLVEMCGPEFSSPNFASSLTEVLGVVLDAEVSWVTFADQNCSHVVMRTRKVVMIMGRRMPLFMSVAYAC